jgi:cytochrome c553
MKSVSMKQRIFSLTATAAAFGALAYAGGAQAADLENGRAIVESHNCAACHGATLNNPVNPAYPKIAGQYADYLDAALRSYKAGGKNPLFGRDNAIMAAQVQELSDEDMKDVAAYISSLPSDLVVKK